MPAVAASTTPPAAIRMNCRRCMAEPPCHRKVTSF
jgi:hypothetical protein